ncbi:tRNA (adenosine(37)-N6)-dimethylallyltransferase MiaA [Dehalococcoidia bacterium]|nr:tRNA (adenosine(37)-N6)-dimethylallyltransferase MiaA [Dehalococcoidia bacterium]
MKSLVAILGPTAVGKSKLAMDLAQQLDGEIISADSRQVYRFLDIGTAKPTPEERSLVPHHLIDIVDPDEDFNLATYQGLAHAAINDVQRRGKLPFLVGGSGLYVRAVLEGWSIPQVPPNAQIRQKLEARAEAGGGDTLFQELRRLDPEAAGEIDPRNLRRVIRALEVCRSTGKRFSELRKKASPDFDTLIIGLTVERAELYRRIDSRVDRMIEQGLVEEVSDLIGRGYSPDLPSMSSVGYQEIGRFLSGETDLATAVQRVKYETHRFARHQYAWFRLRDERIHWFESNEETGNQALELIFRWLDRCNYVM